jgi:hypothetical protein
MDEYAGVESLADLEYDLEGSRARAAWVACLGSQGLPAEERTLVVRPRAAGPTAEPTGESLLMRRPPATRARYRTVGWLETQFVAAPADADFACLTASACQVIESELGDLLLAPAREVAGTLAEALRDGGKPKQAELLQPWADGRFPPTIGTASVVLMGLRYAADRPACVRFLEANFRPGFAALARSKELGAALDTIRTEFRNPACHGLRAFGPAEYQQFARLAVAREQLAEWVRAGPRLSGAAGALGLLHHLLAGSLRLSDPGTEAREPSPAERLLGLAVPRASGLAVRLELVRDPAAAVPGLRDLRPARLSQPVRVGDTVVFRFQANRPCGVALIDLGTSGAASAVLPNRWVPTATAEANRPVLFPDPRKGEFDFELSGPSGVERVVAVAWEGRLPVPLAPAGEHPFRELPAAEVAALCDALAALPADRWAACAVEFEVAP